MSACERSRVKISTSGPSGAAASGADHPTRAVSGSTRCAAPCTSGRRVPAGRHRRPPAWTGPALRRRRVSPGAARARTCSDYRHGAKSQHPGLHGCRTQHRAVGSAPSPRANEFVTVRCIILDFCTSATAARGPFRVYRAECGPRASAANVRCSPEATVSDQSAACTSSNLVGCSIGRSAGLIPRKTLTISRATLCGSSPEVRRGP